MQREVVFVSGARTAIGTFGGALRDVPPIDLATQVVRSAIERSGVSAGDVQHVVMGHVVNTEPRDLYLSRVAAINAGCSKETPAFNVNRLCGSGLQAIVSAAQVILLGDADVVVAGGAENMSRAPFLAPSHRWGHRMGDDVMVDMMLGALNDPFQRIHMGVTAENVAAQWQITREQQDALALESHRRATHATAAGHFRSQIVPVILKTRKGETIFDADEHVRSDVTLAELAKLRAVFKDGGTVTAGNASGINDGAAALVMLEGTEARRRGLMPMARLVSYAHSGVDAHLMGIGPVPAVRKALKAARLEIAQMDVIESNEAFAAQACAVAGELGFDPEKVNPNGSGISLGHPVGATGAILLVKALYELQRTGGRYALVTMCIGGGQGIAAVFERNTGF